MQYYINGVLNICEYFAILVLSLYFILVIYVIVKVIKNIINNEPVKQVLSQLNIFNMFKKNDEVNKMQTIILKVFIVMIILGGISLVLRDSMSEEEIGSFLEKSEYTAYYYVNMFP